MNGDVGECVVIYDGCLTQELAEDAINRTVGLLKNYPDVRGVVAVYVISGVTVTAVIDLDRLTAAVRHGWHLDEHPRPGEWWTIRADAGPAVVFDSQGQCQAIGFEIDRYGRRRKRKSRPRV